MITIQDKIDIRPVKIDFYWGEKAVVRDDGKLREVYPHFVMTEASYTWEELEW